MVAIRFLTCKFAFVLLLLSSVFQLSLSADEALLKRGKTLYGACVACHGPSGNGSPALKAPQLAGLPQWYIAAQLKKFKSGARGAHPDDITGLQMRPMARTLTTDKDVEAVAAHVSQMKSKEQAASFEGDLVKGKAAYQLCVACHGPNAEGNQALNSPPLTHLQDWYLLAQLKKFKSGQRGADPKDVSGATMRPMAMTLADEQAMKDVIVYIKSLSKQ